MSDDDFSVDLDELERGGVNLSHVAEVAIRIHSHVTTILAQYPDPGGDGDVGKSFAVNYTPAAAQSVKFLKSLKELIDTHGGKTLDMSAVFGNVNGDASSVANHGGRKG
jgi:hypothetical protein